MEMIKVIIQFSGYHENGSPTKKKFTILTFDSKFDLSMHKIIYKLIDDGFLSPFRANKEVDIYFLQVV